MSKSTSIPYDFSTLSDTDIQLLYDIIRLAESSDLPTFRALFNAYDKILREYGVQKEHDQIYFRFLLRLGETQGDGLFERFENLLQKLGFEIRFDDDENNERRPSRMRDRQYQNRDLEGPTTQEDESAEEQPVRRASGRRASFDSAYDTQENSRRAEIVASVPSPTRPHSTDILHRRQDREVQVTRPRRRQDARQPVPQSASLAPARGRSRQRGTIRQNGHVPRQVSVSRARDRQTALAHHPRHDEEPDYTSGDDYDEHSEAEELRQERVEHANIKASKAAQHEALVRHIAQMEVHAKVLRHHHLAAQALMIFHAWRRRAITSHNRNTQLHQVAAQQDAQTLLHQALDQWKTALLQRRHEQQTEHFFTELSLKASKARDLFLLTKAFTHWAAAAEEQVIRSNVARRHILRTRYFKAWRDITLTNEAKVRRCRLLKVVNIWKRKTATNLRMQRGAEVLKESNMVSQHYRNWFWHFCERRAPTWYASKLKSKLFGKWLDATRQAQVRESWAFDFKNFELVRTATAKWSRRSSVVAENHERAELFRRRKLIEPNVETLKTEITLSPLLTRMIRVVDARVARVALRIWIRRLRTVRQADELCRARQIRNIWTVWNDRLRCQALSHSIDDRVVLQSLYRWVLAERLKLFQRVREEKVISKVFRHWNTQMNDTCAALGRAKYLLRQFRERKALRSSLAIWSTRTQNQGELNARADSVLHNKQLSQSLISWASNSRHVNQLDGWASDARFFVLASRSIKRWQSAATAHQQDKRRTAYSIVRRKVKVSLARRAFHTWQSRTADHGQLHHQAEELAHRHTIVIVPEVFHVWHDRTVYQHQAYDNATHFHARSTLATTLSTLRVQLSRISNLDSQAADFRAATVADTAASGLRKLNWAVFQEKRLNETAISLAERNQRKHYKGMLRYWRDSMERRRRPVGRRLFQSVIDGGEPPSGTDQPMQFDEDLIEFSTTTPAPSAPRSARQRYSFRSSIAPAPPATGIGKATTQQTPAQPATIPRPAMTGPLTTATPGYLRTPSRRSTVRKNVEEPQKSRSRLQQLQREEPHTLPLSPQLAPAPTAVISQASADAVVSDVLNTTTTPAGLPPRQSSGTPALSTSTLTPFANRLRGLSLGASLQAQRGIPLVAPARSSRFGASTSRFGQSKGFLQADDIREDIDAETEEDETESPSRGPGTRIQPLGLGNIDEDIE